MESEWLKMAKRLHSVAEKGIAYATDLYERGQTIFGPCQVDSLKLDSLLIDWKNG
jgi:hypothetical protein